MAGVIQMMHGENATLREYNEEFKTLQKRAKVKPLQPYVAADSQPTTQTEPVAPEAAQQPMPVSGCLA